LNCVALRSTRLTRHNQGSARDFVCIDGRGDNRHWQRDTDPAIDLPALLRTRRQGMRALVPLECGYVQRGETVAGALRPMLRCAFTFLLPCVKYEK
jgi:hypothetical protein